MGKIVPLAALCFSALLCSSAGVAQDPCADCPDLCTGGVNDPPPTGTLPPGLSFGFLGGSPLDGCAKPECASTCQRCRREVVVSFDSFGTGYCLSLTWEGSFVSSTTQYHRVGKLYSLCGGQSCAEAKITGCDGGPTVYTKVLCVTCAC
jgi:hypothetical protein